MVLFFAFFAGVLSVLAPCVLPMLPVLLGGGLAKKDSSAPYVILISSLVFIFLFSFVLKVSTVFLGISQTVLNWISALIIAGYGVLLLFPQLWDWIKLQFPQQAQIVKKKEQKSGFWWEVILGASLGPLFASCSPTYALIIGTILPQSLWMGTLSIVIYLFGFGLVLFLVLYFGKEAVKKLNRYANPDGIFKKVLGIILIITGVLVASGGMKYLEAQLVNSSFGTYFVKFERDALKGL